MKPPVAAWPYPCLIAHRGAGRLAPENTLASMRLGATHGFKMMEYDVKLSSDGVAILLHDDELDRTTSHSGRASDLSYAGLAAVDAGAWHSPQYAGEPIPSLDAIASFTLANGISSNIEIKPTKGDESETGRKVALRARELWQGASPPPLLSSFSEASLQAALEAAPELPRALLFAKVMPPDWLERVRRLECMGVNLNQKYTDRAAVDAALAEGLNIVIWTVNDPERAREFLRWGCHAIVTDEIIALSPDNFS